VINGLNITARQYGEVVLPDDSTGQGPGTPRQRGQKTVTVQGGYGTCFCSHGTNFIAFRRDRGIMFLSGREFLPVQEVDKWALAQCRGTKLSRRQNVVMVQDLNCVQMSVSGYNEHYKFVLGAGSKAKTVTNNLPILSVLYAGFVKI